MNRKEAIRAYKETVIPQGIFELRCKTTGAVWVGASPNLNAARNREWFQLGSRSHRNKALQSEWDAHGADAFEFGVLETLDPDTPAIGARDLLRDKQTAWVEKRGAKAL